MVDWFIILLNERAMASMKGVGLKPQRDTSAESRLNMSTICNSMFAVHNDDEMEKKTYL